MGERGEQTVEQVLSCREKEESPQRPYATPAPDPDAWCQGRGAGSPQRAVGAPAEHSLAAAQEPSGLLNAPLGSWSGGLSGGMTSVLDCEEGMNFRGSGQNAMG